MLIDPSDLKSDLDTLEGIEKASMRLVTQAIVDFRDEASAIFNSETDLPQDFAEDITREALDQLGVSRIPQRLYGKIDYKRARYVFHPDYALRQALFVDSKAEKTSGRSTATLQIAQTSLKIMHVRAGSAVEVQGTLEPIIHSESGSFLSTTIFVKYNYEEDEDGSTTLDSITVACVPHAFLQDKYNPDSENTIWRAGRNAQTLGEAFRVRLVFRLLKERAVWRVQQVPATPSSFEWLE